MKNRIIVLVLMFVVMMTVGSAGLLAQDSQSSHGQGEPPIAGIHWAKGEAPPNNNSGKTSSPNLIYNQGPVMSSSDTPQVTAIFWGLSWNPSSPGDKITGMDTFYSGIGGSNYAATADEYTDATGPVTSTIAYHGHIIDDLTAASDGTRTAPILAEVCKEITKITTPVSNGYYPVYVDLKRGHAGYCAWHSVGTCGATQVQFAFFFNLDGDPGCDPQDTSGLHPQGLAALANVSGHELSEARTDPHLNAWYDSSGSENADKCAWTFGTPLVAFTNNGSQWKIQGNWSNKAYNAGTGYANSSGQKGCIDGGNYN